jgi:hypothetical protein
VFGTAATCRTVAAVLLGWQLLGDHLRDCQIRPFCAKTSPGSAE